MRRSLERFRARASRRARQALGELAITGFASAVRRLPVARPERHRVQVLRDIPYLPGGAPEHTLDIYRPVGRPRPHPVILYVHGGGFSQLSKNTHWIMGLVFARYGYLVANISYRLAPKHPFPAAIADSAAAYCWVIDNIERYGGDLSRFALAGESAGANLVTALTVAACYQRPEPYARRVFDSGVIPRATIPACGLLQVSDPGRFSRRRELPRIVDGVIHDVSRWYLRGVDREREGALDMADPLVFLERGRAPDRPLPPFFVPVGTRDPILDDTRRLRRALDHLGVHCQDRYYEREIHAFHALVWRRPARRCWRDMLAFLHQHLEPAAEQLPGGEQAAG